MATKTAINKYWIVYLRYSDKAATGGHVTAIDDHSAIAALRVKAGVPHLGALKAWEVYHVINDRQYRLVGKDNNGAMPTFGGQWPDSCGESCSVSTSKTDNLLSVPPPPPSKGPFALFTVGKL